MIERMGDLTLDVNDPQVLLHVPLDPNGYTEHHRVLLCRLGPGRWVAATPDHDLDILDLNSRRHTVLSRRAVFPAHLADAVYAFDPLTRNELEQLRRQAKTMSVILGDEVQEDVPNQVWVFSDPSSSRIGSLVPHELFPEAITMGSKALVEVEGETETIEEIEEVSLKTYADSRRGSLGDVRTNGNHLDGQNKRYISLADALTIMRRADLPDWGFQGPRATEEYLRSIKESGFDLPGYHLQWVKTSGVNAHTLLVHNIALWWRFSVWLSVGISSTR